MQQQPILFGVSSAASFPPLLELARQCAGRGEDIAFVYEHGEDRAFDTIRRAAAELGATAHEMGERAERPPTLAQRLRSRFLPRTRPAQPPSKQALFRKLHAARLKLARRLLKSLSPKLLVVAEDGITGNMWLMTAAREAGIPIVDCPYGYGTHRDLESVIADKIVDGSLITAEGPEGRVVAERHPQWVKNGRFEGALMYPPEDILARESLGITLSDAWIIHGGLADRICVESRRMLDFYIEEGLPSDKLELTGSPYCDIMHRALERDAAARAAFLVPRKIEPGRTRVLVSWPPSYHADRSGKCAFPSYGEMSRTVLGFLASLPDVDLSVSLHPAMPDEDRVALEPIGVSIADDYLIELIPRCDVFVSCFSSTIRWAIAAGKPVVNFDLYGFALPDYDDASGVLLVESLDAFRSVVLRLTADEHYAGIAACQIEDAERYGAVDGRGFDRIYGLMSSLASA